MLSLRINLSNANRLYGSKSSQIVVLWDSNLIFDLTQLLAVGETLLCDYPMVVDYILEINLRNVKRFKHGFIHFWWAVNEKFYKCT